MSVPLLRMRGISKSFGATRALDGVSCDLNAGEVMALIGENGAGKSTLMKILSGAHRPDAGTMELAGRPFLAGNPQESRAAGVAMIYQELNLAPDLSVEDNIMLGQEAGHGCNIFTDCCVPQSKSNRRRVLHPRNNCPAQQNKEHCGRKGQLRQGGINRRIHRAN